MLLFSGKGLFAQSDDPWGLFAPMTWSNNNNITGFGAGNNTGYTLTSAAIIGNPTVPACGTPTNDIWYRVPYVAGTTSLTVKVTFTNSDYTDPIDDTRPRYAIYKGPSGGCNSSSCPLTYVTCGSDNDLDESGEQDCLGSSLYYTNLSSSNIAISPNEDLYIRIWEQDNDPEHRYTVHVVRNGTSPSAGSNDGCGNAQYIVSGAPCPYSGSNYGAGGGGFPALGSDACSWGLQENNVYYEFQATSTSVNIQLQGVRCFWTGCTNVPGLALQYAIFRKRQPDCNSVSYPGDVMNVPSNSAYDCFIGQGTVGGTVDGLTPGQRYILVLDGWNASPCTWTGITISNTPSLPTINTASRCASDPATTLTVNTNGASGYSYSWSSSPADTSLAGQTSNQSVNVSPTVTTTYTVNVNMGGSGTLCNGLSASSYPLHTTVNVLTPNGSRLAPTGQQCSGTTLNFTANPAGGNGAYTYSWSTATGVTGSGQNFSFTPVNNTAANQTVTVTLNVTSNGRTCTQTFTPTIKPIPVMNTLANVDCNSGIVTAGMATVGGSPCVGCTYTLEACAGCDAAATPVGTSNGTGIFTLTSATQATVSATLNGCKSANQVLDFLDGPYNCQYLLPVELSSFSAKCEAASVDIRWTTLSETNNRYFDVERSTDFIQWDHIARVDGAGYSTAPRTYVLRDEVLPASVVYYRLRQTDGDGRSRTFDIVRASCRGDAAPVFEVYPNPAVDEVFIGYDLPFPADRLSCTLTDDLGRQLRVVSIPIDIRASTGKTKFSTAGLAAGVYFLQVRAADTVFKTLKLLVRQ